MAQTIDVVVVYRGGRHSVDSRFVDLESAVRRGLHLANTAGHDTAKTGPTEVRVLEEGQMVLAVRVLPGGLAAARDGVS